MRPRPNVNTETARRGREANLRKEGGGLEIDTRQKLQRGMAVTCSEQGLNKTGGRRLRWDMWPTTYGRTGCAPRSTQWSAICKRPLATNASGANKRNRAAVCAAPRILQCRSRNHRKPQDTRSTIGETHVPFGGDGLEPTMKEAQMRHTPSDTRPPEHENVHTPHSGGTLNECAEEEELMGHAAEYRDRLPAVCGKRT